MTIMIQHAYNGLLYAPLFLAEELGLLPNDSKLNYAGSDEDCLKALCSNCGNTNAQNWFAICDPFSVEDMNRFLPHGDLLCVIGCLVNKLPVWVVNKNQEVYHENNESRLKRYTEKLKAIRCYPKGTTGHLIGKRLQKDICPQWEIEPKPFGGEFDGLLNNETLVVTSDIFHIVHHDRHDNNDIVFDYTLDSPDELSPFLFTGILTLRERVLDDNLWAAVTLLTGIKKAIQLLKTSPDRERYIELLLKNPRRYKKQLNKMGLVDEKAQKEIIKDSLDFIFGDKRKIYNEDLMPDSIAWDNAQKQWESIEGRKHVGAQITEEPIPSLLIKSGWRKDTKLHNAINPSNGIPPISKNKVFVVHGHDIGAKDSIARFLEQLSLEPVIIAEQANAGQTIIEKFKSNSDVAFAVVLLTPDDIGKKKTDPDFRPRARQNVIFELGFFLARLGSKNVAAVIKGNVEKPSDFDGVGYIKMDDQEAWQTQLKRELEVAGLKFDSEARAK